MPRRAWLAFFAVLLVTANCARVQSPPGGEIDKEPAEIVESWPADGSVGNGNVSSITLGFSEAVSRATVLEQLRTDPPWLLRSVHWHADTLLTLRYWDPFPADTTIAFFLVPGWRDLHRVEQPGWQVIHFATGPKLLSGWLAGKATFKGNASRALYLELSDSLKTIKRSTRPDRAGSFAFRHLPVDERSWKLTAWQDSDGDSLFDPSIDFSDSLADSLLFLNTETAQRLDLRINVIDPTEPGEITGSFACTDTLAGAYVIRFFADSLRLPADSIPSQDPAELPDSLIAALRNSVTPFHLWLPEPGSFSFEGISPGPWYLIAHKETTGDSIWDPGSEAAFLDPGPRFLDPAGRLKWPNFKFPLDTDSDTNSDESAPDSSQTSEESP